jgi:SHAQKYF class myb-like DNA-binding protein
MSNGQAYEIEFKKLKCEPDVISSTSNENFLCDLTETGSNSNKNQNADIQFLGMKRELTKNMDSLINKRSYTSNFDKYNTGRWKETEHKKFLEAICTYGNNWKKVQECIGTRSSTQARSHAQKFFMRIKKYLSYRKSKPTENEVKQEENGKLNN